MKLGICVPHYGRPIEVDRMLAVVRHAGEAGFDSVWVTDHVIVPRDVDVIYREHMLDPLAVLPWLAAATARVALGTSYWSSGPTCWSRTTGGASYEKTHASPPSG